VYVAIAGNVGNLPDVENMDINYAQSAVFTPSDFAFPRDGIAAEADANEETILVCDLDLDALHASRTAGSVTPRLDRRPDLFRIVSSITTSTAERGDKDGLPLGDQPGTDEPIPPAPVAGD
jgi:predicted amidohydrolase